MSEFIAKYETWIFFLYEFDKPGLLPMIKEQFRKSLYLIKVDFLAFCDLPSISRFLLFIYFISGSKLIFFKSGEARDTSACLADTFEVITLILKNYRGMLLFLFIIITNCFINN